MDKELKALVAEVRLLRRALVEHWNNERADNERRWGRAVKATDV